MTAIPKARLVLQDVVRTRMLLEVEPDDVGWRLKWILAVVLLRSVGYAMEKGDARSSPIVDEVQKEFYLRWKTERELNEIFWEFIDKQRHLILKEYELAMSEGPIPVTADLVGHDGALAVLRACIRGNDYRPMADGFYEGNDGRVVIDMAISWWEEQLNAIDQTIAERSGMGGRAAA